MGSDNERDLEYMEIKWDCHVRGHKYRDEWYFTVMDGCGNYWNGERWEADDEYCGRSDDAGMPDRDAVLAQFEQHGTMPDYIALDETRKQLSAAVARAEKAEKERDAYAKAKAENDERFQLEAAKWRGLYDKAWEECGTWRYANGARTESGWTSTRYAGDGEYYADYPNHAADAHDAARKEAGL
jgi:hypothetical protein